MKYYVWLQSVLGAGNCRAKEILELFKDAKSVFDADFDDIKKSRLFNKKELLKLQNKSLKEAEEIVLECKQNGIEIIPLNDKRYPYCLSVISDAPLVLYVKGNLPKFDNLPAISIVGPRRITEFGKKAAFSLSYRLAKSGFIVVSGGALGGDTNAHAGALKAGGITVLIMACGILSKYLPENKKLRDAVEQTGCLISEHPPRVEPTKYSFPIRNRIVSALSLGTIVVEASAKSGALITARLAAEQGRDVFVVPARPNMKEYEGSNALLRDGAKPILDVSDIFGEYIVRFPDKINIEKAFEPITKANTKKSIQKNEKNLPETLSKEAKIVYNYLDKQKFLPEDILGTGLSSNEILSALIELEMELLVKAVPGGMYEKL